MPIIACGTRAAFRQLRTHPLTRYFGPHWAIVEAKLSECPSALPELQAGARRVGGSVRLCGNDTAQLCGDVRIRAISRSDWQSVFA